MWFPLAGARLQRGGRTARYWYTDGPLECRFQADESGVALLFEIASKGGGVTQLCLHLTGDDLEGFLREVARTGPGLERAMLESFAIAIERRTQLPEPDTGTNELDGAVTASRSILRLSLGMARGALDGLEAAGG